MNGIFNRTVDLLVSKTVDVESWVEACMYRNCIRVGVTLYILFKDWPVTDTEVLCVFQICDGQFLWQLN